MLDLPADIAGFFWRERKRGSHKLARQSLLHSKKMNLCFYPPFVLLPLQKIDVSDPDSEPSSLKVVLDISDAVTTDIEEVRGVLLFRGLCRCRHRAASAKVPDKSCVAGNSIDVC